LTQTFSGNWRLCIRLLRFRSAWPAPGSHRPSTSRPCHS
jgi:hypothetical protein